MAGAASSAAQHVLRCSAATAEPRRPRTSARAAQRLCGEWASALHAAPRARVRERRREAAQAVGRPVVLRTYREVPYPPMYDSWYCSTVNQLLWREGCFPRTKAHTASHARHRASSSALGRENSLHRAEIAKPPTTTDGAQPDARAGEVRLHIEHRLASTPPMAREV